MDVVFQHSDGRVQRVKKASPVNTRKGAEQYERELRQSLLAGTFRKERKESPTLEQFSEKFMVEAETNNKYSTARSKKFILKNHLKPAFGKKRLSDITAYDIEAFKAKKLKEDFDPKTINNFLTVLRKLLSLAVDWDELSHIPKLKWMRAPLPDIDFLSFEEAERLAAATEAEWKAMVVVALNTGLRLGELAALQWDSVDLVARKLFVRRNVYRNQYGTPKGGRSREVPLNGTALAALKAERHLKGPWVFCDEVGRPRNAHNACQAALGRACKKAGLRKFGWHTLRHTFASQLVMRGVPLKAVQELLGHATIDMTMRYAHLSPDVKVDAVSVLDGRPATPKGPPHGPYTAHGKEGGEIH